MEKESLAARNREIAREAAAREEILHRMRRAEWRSVPRYLAWLAAGAIAIWAAKSCGNATSPNTRLEEDRSGVKGAPY